MQNASNHHLEKTVKLLWRRRHSLMNTAGVVQVALTLLVTSGIILSFFVMGEFGQDGVFNEFMKMGYLGFGILTIIGMPFFGLLTPLCVLATVVPYWKGYFKPNQMPDETLWRTGVDYFKQKGYFSIAVWKPFRKWALKSIPFLFFIILLWAILLGLEVAMGYGGFELMHKLHVDKGATGMVLGFGNVFFHCALYSYLWILLVSHLTVSFHLDLGYKLRQNEGVWTDEEIEKIGR